MNNQNNDNKNKPWPDLLIHLAISCVLTYFILLLIEQSWPNSVTPFLNSRWLLWGAGILVLIALIVTGFDRKSVPGKPVTGQSKHTGNQLS